MEPFIVLETTRGCPYKCVFCEWGGGINTKIYKKDVSIVKRDVLALKKAGYRDAYLDGDEMEMQMDVETDMDYIYTYIYIYK